MLMRAPLALLPVLLFLVGLVQLDGYKLVRLRMMLALVAAGALAAGASYLLNNAAYAHFAGGFAAYSRYVSPWIEEALKAALLVFLIRTRRVGLPVDAAIAGFAIGTGFALVENIYYLIRSRTRAARGGDPRFRYGDHAWRNCGGAGDDLEHALRAAASGVCICCCPAFWQRWLHTGFNYLLVRPALATLATLLVLPFVIYLVFDHSERILRNWIEVDLESDVKLLESISAGTFLGSNSGRYLQALRDRFRGEELADMLCYLRVHGELAVRAKGVLLMREAGLPEPPIEAETRDRLAEFAHLERAIGKAGVIALRPLMMATGKEVWQLTLLRP